MGGFDPLSVGIGPLIDDAAYALVQLDEQPKVAEAWTRLGLDPAVPRDDLVRHRDEAEAAWLAGEHGRDVPGILRRLREAWRGDLLVWRKDVLLVVQMASRRPETARWAGPLHDKLRTSLTRHFPNNARWFRAAMNTLDVIVAEYGTGWDTLDVLPRGAALLVRLEAVDDDVAAKHHLRQQAAIVQEDARLALRASLRSFREHWELARSAGAHVPPLRSLAATRKRRPVRPPRDEGPSAETAARAGDDPADEG